MRLSQASVVTVLSKAEVRRWHEDGLLPPSAFLLFVTLHPRNARDLTVELELLHAGQPSTSLAFPAEAPAELAAEAVVSRPFLFVRGEGDLAGLSFPEVELVDANDASPEGFAPEVEVTALGRPPQGLPLTARKRRPPAFSR